MDVCAIGEVARSTRRAKPEHGRRSVSAQSTQTTEAVNDGSVPLVCLR